MDRHYDSSMLYRPESTWPPLSFPSNVNFGTQRTSGTGVVTMPFLAMGSPADAIVFMVTVGVLVKLVDILFYLQFSEDSGFSSCGSSASSVADDSDVPPCSVPSAPIKNVLKTSFLPSQKNRRINNCHGPQSGTVASVLAAGVASDSEEADHLESDEESVNIFHSCAAEYNLNLISKSLWRQRYPLGDGQHSFHHDKPMLLHSGRDILDLGSNLRTRFPLRPSELPERNLPLYLLNRSQYHRLGKFGTTEVLHYIVRNSVDLFFLYHPAKGQWNIHVSDNCVLVSEL